MNGIYSPAGDPAHDVPRETASTRDVRSGERCCHRGDLRIMGPNCLGLMYTVNGLNATFASAMARPGSVGFISRSGALRTAILD